MGILQAENVEKTNIWYLSLWKCHEETHLNCSKTDNGNVQRFFATLLQNELKSYVVRFTIHESNLSCNKSILASDWTKFRGSYSLHGNYVNCCKKNLS